MRCAVSRAGVCGGAGVGRIRVRAAGSMGRVGVGTGSTGRTMCAGGPGSCVVGCELVVQAAFERAVEPEHRTEEPELGVGDISGQCLTECADSTRHRRIGAPVLLGMGRCASACPTWRVRTGTGTRRCACARSSGVTCCGSGRCAGSAGCSARPATRMGSGCSAAARTRPGSGGGHAGQSGQQLGLGRHGVGVGIIEQAVEGDVVALVGNLFERGLATRDPGLVELSQGDGGLLSQQLHPRLDLVLDAIVDRRRRALVEGFHTSVTVQRGLVVELLECRGAEVLHAQLGVGLLGLVAFGLAILVGQGVALLAHELVAEPERRTGHAEQIVAEPLGEVVGEHAGPAPVLVASRGAGLRGRGARRQSLSAGCGGHRRWRHREDDPAAAIGAGQAAVDELAHHLLGRCLQLGISGVGARWPGMQQLGRWLRCAAVATYVLLDLSGMGLEGPTGVAAFVGHRATNDLLGRVGQLVGQCCPPCRLVERADLVGDVDLTIAGERLCIHCPRLGRHRRAAVHEAVADIDPQHVAQRGPHVAGHGLRGWHVGTLTFGAHGLGEGTVVGGSETLSPRVGETCTARPAGAAAVIPLGVGGRWRRDDQLRVGGCDNRKSGLADRQQLVDRRQRQGVCLAPVGGNRRELAVLDCRQCRCFLQRRRRLTVVGHCRGKYTAE